MTLKAAIDDFLAQKNIAVVGVSRQSREAANVIYRKLRDQGYRVIPVNPRATEVEGDPCFPDLGAIDGQIDAAVIATPPSATVEVVRQCAERGVSRVWIHRSFGQGSVSEEALRLCRERGISVIPGACPMMFCQPVDPAHTCMRWMLGLFGRLPTGEMYPTHE